MGRKCGVDGCLSDSHRTEDQGVTFHKVPIHSDIRPKWISLCRIPEDKQSSKVIYICSRHFLRVDFCNFKGKKYMLRQGVLPSVFPWDKSKLEAIKSGSKVVEEISETEAVKKENEGILETEAAKKEKEGIPETEVTKKDEMKTETELDGELKVEPEERDAAETTNTKPDVKEALDIDTEVKSAVDVTPEVDKNAEDEIKPIADTKPEVDTKPMVDVKPVIDEKVFDAINSTNLNDNIKIDPDALEKDGVSDKEKVFATSKNGLMQFSINARIEVLDNDNLWYPAQIVEIDFEENEILIHFENFSNKYDEWICMDSPRLRPIQQAVDTSTPPTLYEQYVIGERCLASWSDAKRFPATVTKCLSNGNFFFLFH